MLIRGLEFNVVARGAGTPLVWAHGLLGSVATDDATGWYDWPAFPATRRLIRYDARGHGRSAASHHPEDYHWTSLGRDMLALADAMAVDGFVAGGASMGSMTALCAAVQDPARIRGLVLVTPPALWEARHATSGRHARGALIGKLLGARRMAALVRNAVGKAVPAWLPRAERERLASLPEELFRMDGSTWWNLLRGVAGSNLPPREALAALADIPVSIIAWEGDATHPLASAHELHRLLPQSTLFVVRDYEGFKTIPQHIRDFVAAHSQP